MLVSRHSAILRGMWRRLVWGSLGIACAVACGDDHLCEAAGCLGPPTQVSLLDDAGRRVAARGETRLRTADYEIFPQAFDCTTETDECANGVLFAQGPGGPDTELELRFELEDGSFSEWQKFPLETTAHTDPDFNGEDCPCTSYAAKPLRVVVPEAARLDAITSEGGAHSE